MTSEIRILAVEDDEDIRRLLEQVFENAGLPARVVGSLAEFRSSLAQEDAGICIVDIGLPDGDGLSLVSELRAVGGRGIVILTGRGSELDQVLGLELGADALYPQTLQTTRVIGSNTSRCAPSGCL